jgi:hypothetical protein
LLNRAARYFPILREIRRGMGPTCTLLDVGSGARGIGEFWAQPFVGCDVSFEERPRVPMRPVLGSGTQLPFADQSFDVVVASDVMEHVPPEGRGALIREVLRVARRVAVFGYPCGEAAFAADKKLGEKYRSRGARFPIWLEEHMRYPFPDEELFREIPEGWQAKVIPNETIEFHYWMMVREMRRPFAWLFRLAVIAAPRLVESLLRRADREPSYRKIFVLTHQRQPG